MNLYGFIFSFSQANTHCMLCCLCNALGAILKQSLIQSDAGEEKKCVEKVVLEEETEWNEEVQCHHR